MKRCGKSAPRSWQHGWQAKPRTEQDQIGEPRPARKRRVERMAHPKLSGRLLDLASNGEARGMVVIHRSAARREGGTEFGLRLAVIFTNH